MPPDLRERLQSALGTAYTLDRELGGGGMSRVFVATETRHGRQVVIKVLSPDLAQAMSGERFEREMRLAASLQQANIVPLLTSGEADGLAYYTMPYVDGQSLRARLAQGPVAIPEVLSILRDVARALAYAHAHGTVHRDIKPDNILLSGGTAVVADFGIAKAIQAARTSTETAAYTTAATLTQLGTSIGTPAYIAPEQAAGDPHVDHRADLYAFGCVAYELLAGHPPFHGMPPHKLLAAHMGQPPRPVQELRSDTPTALAALVMQCLAKDVAERPQDAHDLVTALDAVATTSGAGPAVPAHLLAQPFRTRVALAWWSVGLLATYILARAAIVGIGLPDWVLPGALGVVLLGLPAILVTGYVQRTARRVALTTPTLTPGGSPAPQGTLATMAVQAAPHLTWHRTRTAAVVAGVGFVGLVAAAMGMRQAGIGPFASLQATGAFGAREPLVVADFDAVGDTTLGPVIAEAVRADLAQSRAVELVSPAALGGALERMGRARDAALTVAVARELGVREGYKGVVAGEVRQIGASYLVTVRLVSADSGRELASFRRTAKSSDALIATAGQLARELRGKIGESLRSVQRSPTVDKVSTPSLAALRNYTLANQALFQRGDFPEFDRLMTEAIKEDTAFAMAYRRLGIEVSNRGIQFVRAESLLTKAYRYRERLSPYERAMAEGSYFSRGPVEAVDTRKALDAYRRAVDADPAAFGALNNTALMYAMLGEQAPAESLYRAAVALGSATASTYTNLMGQMMTIGRFAAADSVYTRFVAAYPNHPDAVRFPAIRAAMRGQRDSAEATLRAAVAAAGADPARREALSGPLRNVIRLRGRLREAERLQAPALAAAQTRGELAVPVNAALGRANDLALLLGPNDRSRAILDSVLRSGALDRIPFPDRPYSSLVATAALVGDARRAAEFAALSERQLRGSDTTIRQYVHLDRATVAMAAGRFDEASRELDGYGVSVAEWGFARMFRAHLHDRAGQVDSAIVWWERVVGGPMGGPVPWATMIPHGWDRLGSLYEQKGEYEKGIQATEQFLELWKYADPELQPRVREATQRLERLRGKVPR
jgi:tRNA A-37 threonylcarbamoyl transferase component Bud32/tetratricopeptide (TPR) repeat protein